MKFKYFKEFIPVYLANDDIQKARKSFYGQQGESIIVNGRSKMKITGNGYILEMVVRFGHTVS